MTLRFCWQFLDIAGRTPLPTRGQHPIDLLSVVKMWSRNYIARMCVWVSVDHRAFHAIRDYGDLVRLKVCVTPNQYSLVAL